jgi:large subunit ribosomal protein L7A
MSYEKELTEGELRIGTKQATKAVEQGRAAKLFVARDADPKLTVKIVNLAKKMNVEVDYVDTMQQLGKACGIEVGAAAVVIVNK